MLLQKVVQSEINYYQLSLEYKTTVKYTADTWYHASWSDDN